MSALTGKSDGGVDDSQCLMFDDGPVIDEEAPIEEKTKFEKTFILKHRSLFSEKLAPNRFIEAPPMKISLKKNLNRSNSPFFYRFKSC